MVALPDRIDVVVVGGGVSGASTAYFLGRLGLDVLVLERRDDVGTLTTPRSFGSLRTQFGSRALIELATEGVDFYRSATDHFDAADAAALDFRQPGYLYLTPEPDHVARLAAALDEYVALGISSSTLLDRDELHDRFPLAAGGAVAGIHHAEGGWIDPAAVTGAFVRAAEATGRATFVAGTAVTALLRGAGGAVTGVATSGGVVATDRVVDCAGPFANELLGALPEPLPITSTPRYRAFLPCDVDGLTDAPFTINTANGAYWRPVDGGLWISHANVADRPREPLHEVQVPGDFVVDTLAMLAPVSPFLADLAGTPPSEVVAVGGQPCYTPDDAPLIGAVDEVPGLWVDVGHWAGVMLAPGSGRLTAELVAGVRDEADNPFRPGRFADGPVEKSSTNKFGGWG